MSLLRRFSQARRHSRAFELAMITALELEARLLALGFYNVEFNPPAAAYDGVRYPLKEMENV